MSSAAEPRARSIAWPIFALVLASVVAATAILFVVTFSGPPPMVPPRPLETIAATLAGRPPLHRPPPHGGPPRMPPRGERVDRLLLERSAAPPSRRRAGRSGDGGPAAGTLKHSATPSQYRDIRG